MMAGKAHPPVGLGADGADAATEPDRDCREGSAGGTASADPTRCRYGARRDGREGVAVDAIAGAAEDPVTEPGRDGREGWTGLRNGPHAVLAATEPGRSPGRQVRRPSCWGRSGPPLRSPAVIAGRASRAGASLRTTSRRYGARPRWPGRQLARIGASDLRFRHRLRALALVQCGLAPSIGD